MEPMTNYRNTCGLSCLQTIQSILEDVSRSQAPTYMYADSIIPGTTGIINIYPNLYTGMTTEQIYNLTIMQINKIKNS
jgi:hypothetical protein